MLAIENIEFVCQPIVRLGEEKPSLYEVLFRVYKDGELLPASNFIDLVSKDQELIRQIDRKAFDTALKSNLDTVHAVNLSIPTLNDYSFLEYVHQQINKYSKRVDSVVFEITEQDLVDSQGALLVKALKWMGFRVGLDDVCTGYNCYFAIRDVKPSFIKIDGQIIRDILTDPLARDFTKGLFVFANAQKIDVIAEFVENKEIENELLKIKLEVDADLKLLGQGWLYGKGDLCK